MSDTKHQDLVDRSVRGDKAALGELLERFGPDIEAGLSISSTWRGLVDAADVMQVTYLEAFLQINHFDPARADAFSAWLRRIAENNLRDAIRSLEAKKNPSPRKQLDINSGDTTLALFDMLTSASGTPSRATRKEESVERVRQAMRCLPPDYARTIQLYDLESKPVEEVANALGRSTGAIYMLRMRGHECLRGLLGTPSQFFDSQT